MSVSGSNSDEMNCPEGSESAANTIQPAAGMSPYATGGGGVTFERKVAVKYLTHLLVGDGAVEFGEGRRVVSVAFQQAPQNPADDLVIRAARPDELRPSIELELEVRRSPNLVKSNEDAKRLVRRFVSAVLNNPCDDMEHRLGLVVSGARPHAEQLGTLTDLAADQMDAPGFFCLVRTPNRFPSGIRDRLFHIEKLVESALIDLGVTDIDTVLIQQRTWQLLNKLEILMPRVESPDESDWSQVENSLTAVARSSDLLGTSRLRDRLVSLASEYSPRAARVDLSLLRRDAHEALDSSVRRHRRGWSVLNLLHNSALGAVSTEIASVDGERRLLLDRTDPMNELVAAVEENSAVVVSGDSGVGKSALALMTFDSLCTEDPDSAQAFCLNLRHVPNLPLDFEGRLGCPLSTLLCELSAPLRMLVVDGADAVAEGMETAFEYLVDAAERSGVKVVAVVANDSKQVVRDSLAGYFRSDVGEYHVKPLSDSELDDLVLLFTELEGLSSNPRSREVLRRLVVVDLLVRGHLSGIPLNDADAMQEVWAGLVRRREQADRGQPDSRESVLLRLAEVSLSGGDRLGVVNSLDPTAVSGLRQDGLLQTSSDNPFMIGPDFAHDEVRRYAVARLILADTHPTSRILNAGAPRWALGAARLACQVLLAEPDRVTLPLQGRFDALQAHFDALVEAGHGARWGDVPSEALVTLADSSAILRDAWFGLRAIDAAGLRRLARVIGQRTRDSNGLINLNAVEPIIMLLLEDDAPWKSGGYAKDLLREWLRVLAFEAVPSGYDLRIRLRERLVEACAAGDRRLDNEKRAAAAARAIRTPEDIERERRISQIPFDIFTTIGYGGEPHRQRPEVPREYIDEVVLELLALLGPDLGEGGEAIFRRVVEGAPSALAPALEEVFTARALSRYRRGLLADLTQAYYLDDRPHSYSSLDDGIRDHSARRRSFNSPLAAWYLGPFADLFRTDFRNGVAVLNRLLNHAALYRARTLARLKSSNYSSEDIGISPFQAELSITGTKRTYSGDEHVWLWYRSTGVGPYPCMSALQALELVCDQLITAGASIGRVISILLDRCENLAMVSLIVGILVRHLDAAEKLLDPYLTEPLIWRYEFRRVVDEHGMLAANSEGVENPELRKWSLREAATAIAMAAKDDRAAELLALGEVLVERERNIIVQEQAIHGAISKDDDCEGIEVRLATVRAWASSLNRENVEVVEAPDGVYIRAVPPEEVVDVLRESNEDSERVAEVMRLTARYFLNPYKGQIEDIGPGELTADAVSARNLLEDPPSISEDTPWDVPALVAAAILEAHLLRDIYIQDDALDFAIDTVLRVSEGAASPRIYEYEDTYFEQGADRSAARVIPLLLMPSAARLREMIDEGAEPMTLKRISIACLTIARAVASEVRLNLARGLDHIWATPCANGGTCHHHFGLQIVIETMRDCTVGGWNPQDGMPHIVVLDEPIDKSLSNTADDAILPYRLDASIRALAVAATANICISVSARDLVVVLLAAQQRSLLCREGIGFDRGRTHAIVIARALLTLARPGDDAFIFERIRAFVDSPDLLGDLLFALSAAAEETTDRAEAAQRLWPKVIHHVLELYKAGHTPFMGGYQGELTLAALIPNSTASSTYQYREYKGELIVWWDPIVMQSEVEAWLPIATGKALCVDQVIFFLVGLELEEQARVGLPWVAKLVLPSSSQVANGSSVLAQWLIQTRFAIATDADLLVLWQEVVDALVVEGVTSLAAYSE